MPNISITPELILPDNESFVHLKGINIRKGSIAVFINNIDMLEDKKHSKNKRDTALEMIKQLAHTVILTGLYKHVSFKNQIVQKILNKTADSLQES